MQALKRTNSLLLQEKRVSRREFFLTTTALFSAGLLIASPARPNTKTLEKAVKVLSLTPSIVRVGKWIQTHLPIEASRIILRNAEAQLVLASRISKEMLNKIVSEDYKQGRTIIISGIRLSIFEAALYLTASR